MGKSVYLNQAAGNDAADGLTLFTARATWDSAWSLMDRDSDDTLWVVGDYSLGPDVSFNINKPGISPTQRLTVRGYRPDGVTRPRILKTGAGWAVMVQSSPNESDYTALMDLELDGLDSGGGGIRVFTTGGGLLFRNLNVHNFHGNGITIESEGPGLALTIETLIKRCMVHNNHRTVGGQHTSGTFVGYADNVTFDECVFDHNGRLAADDSGTIYNHNFYLSSTSETITVMRTISARASATGIQHRCNDHISDDNLVLDCPLGITFGHDDFAASYPTRHVSFDVTGCSVLGTADISPSEIRSGPGIAFGHAQGGTGDDNIIAHAPSALRGAIGTDRPSTNVTFTNTHIYDWGGVDYEVSGTANPSEPTVSIDTPTTTALPTLADYLTSIGVTPGVDPVETFLALALTNKDGAWDPRFTASAVNAFLRGQDPPGDPDIEGEVPTEPEFTLYPSLTQQGNEEATLLLTVAATGVTDIDSPLTYQWYKDGNPLSGETNLTLTFSFLQESDAGTYYCTVTNVNGTTQGLDITLTVTPIVEETTVPPVRVLRSGMTQLLTNAAKPWRPDRRPIIFAAPYGGGYGTSGNIWGTDLGFESNPVTWMATYKTLADGIGTKRIMPHMWHGALQGSTYSMNMWHGMRDAGRDFFRTTMPTTYEGYSIEPYLGGYLASSRGLADLLTDGGQAATTNDMLLLAQNMLPFLQLGCPKCWVDAFATSDQTDYETLLGYLHSHLNDLGSPSYVVGTEPLPVQTVDSRLDILDEYISERPYIMLEWNYKLTFDYDERWSVDPNTTEVHIIVDGSGAQDANRAATPGYSSDNAMTESNGPHYLDRLAEAGFIVGTNHAGTNNWVRDWIRSRYAPTSTSAL